MFGGILPKEHDFFNLFNEAAETGVKACTEFIKLVSPGSDIERQARTIKELEHHGDELTHQTMTLLHKTFITPLDREDIHELIKRLDDVLDFLDAAAQRIMLYELKKFPPELIKLAEVTEISVQLVKTTIGGLSNMKNHKELLKACVEINRLENEADHMLRSGLAKLFKETKDVIELIKLKEVYELLESVTDRCEDVANIIEGIVVEYA